MKKNLLAILMTSVLCFGLVACGNEQAVVDTNAQTETVDAVEETTEETTEDTEEVTDATALDEADAAATEGEEEISFTAGVVDNTTYTNEDLGIKIKGQSFFSWD